jgi:serine/threonine protein phosphatase PrpC
MLVLACDGLWDVLHAREVKRLVSNGGKDPQTIAEALVERAKRKWIQRLGRVADNITIIVVFFVVA